MDVVRIPVGRVGNEGSTCSTPSTTTESAPDGDTHTSRENPALCCSGVGLCQRTADGTRSPAESQPCWTSTRMPSELTRIATDSRSHQASSTHQSHWVGPICARMPRGRSILPVTPPTVRGRYRENTLEHVTPQGTRTVSGESDAIVSVAGFGLSV